MQKQEERPPGLISLIQEDLIDRFLFPFACGILDLNWRNPPCYSYNTVSYGRGSYGEGHREGRSSRSGRSDMAIVDNLEAMVFATQRSQSHGIRDQTQANKTRYRFRFRKMDWTGVGCGRLNQHETRFRSHSRSTARTGLIHGFSAWSHSKNCNHT